MFSLLESTLRTRAGLACLPGLPPPLADQLAEFFGQARTALQSKREESVAEALSCFIRKSASHELIEKMCQEVDKLGTLPRIS